jgi:hypothetical protein
LVILSAAPAAAQSPAVPPEFQDLHADLASTLEVFAAAVPPATERGPVVFSTELSHADANRLQDLLAPISLTGALMAVDRLADAGVEAVTINISYPMLYLPFHGDAGEYLSYLGFYRSVTSAARQRGLKVIVKSGALLGTDPRVAQFYRSVEGIEAYKAGRLDVATTIVRELEPDFLTLQAEPDVEESQTGQPVGSIEGAHELVSYLVTGLWLRGAVGASLGAGAGTWHDDFYELAQKLLALPGLAYLDVHLYPINRDFLWRALFVADAAHLAGKDVAMSETWLYKVRDAELIVSGALFAELISRDTFSFWEPLDRRYVDVMTRLAVSKRFAFLSFFWSKYFFSYLDYADTFFLTPDQLLALSQVASTQAMLAGRLTSTGEMYQALIWLHSMLERGARSVRRDPPSGIGRSRPGRPRPSPNSRPR